MKKATVLLLCSLAFLSACKDRKKNPIEHVREAAKERDLQNRTFASSCSVKPIEALITALASGGHSSIKSSRTSYKVIGSIVTHTTNFYDNGDCNGEPAIVFTEVGDINIDKDKKTNDGGYHIDIQFSSVRAVAQTSEGVTAANAVELCGKTDWAKNKDYDVSNRSAEATCYSTRVPRKVYTIYRVDADTLYWGPNMNAGAPIAERPSSLNMAVKYVER